jgi:hypothetical protein
MERRRKHHKQMSVEELVYLRALLDSLPDLPLRRHAEYRRKERRLTPENIYNAVKHGLIIEAHNNVKNDIRILLRHNLENEAYAVCAVVSLRKQDIVTAYVNEQNDHHPTLNWALYTWKTNLLQSIPHILGETQSSAAILKSR